MTASTYGRQVVVPLTNKSGGQVIAGDVVIVDTTNNDAFTTSTSGSSTATVGVVQETIASNATGRVLLSGYAALVNVNASVTRGDYGKTYTVAKQATDAGASRVVGTFCQFLTGGTTPDGVVFPSDLGAGSGMSDPMTTRGDIIVRNASNATARLAVGAAGTVLGRSGSDVLYVKPPGYEYDYVEFTGANSITATTEATANTVVTGNAVSYDGSTVVWIEFFTVAARPDTTSAGAALFIMLYDGSSSIGYLGKVRTPAGAASNEISLLLRRKLTPSNASHTYSIRAYVSSGTGNVESGTGGNGNFQPGFIQITQA